MRNIKVVFWNINKKNLIKSIYELINECKADIFAMVEAEKLDVEALLGLLDQNGMKWNDIQISSSNDIRLLAREEVEIIPHKEESHYSIYKIKENGELDILLIVVHLLSKFSKSADGQLFAVNNISRELFKYEQELFCGKEFKTIIVGDFNMQPYESGVCGPMGFNATMSVTQAKKKTRIAAGEKTYLYYNPMWSLMGANKLVQGSYYNTNDDNYNAIYWYSFDSVLLRPCFIDDFNWDYFEIVERTSGSNFVSNTTIDKERYSDHLPIKFEIIGG